MSVIEVVREARVPAGVDAVPAVVSDADRAGEWSDRTEATSGEDVERPTDRSRARLDGSLS